MKKILVAITFIAVLMPHLSFGQASSGTADAEKSLGMAREMLKSFSGITDDFKSFKGDFLMKDNSGNSYYEAKGLNIGADAQYVAVKTSGTVVLLATYKPKDKDDKDPTLAFTAFTGGIKALNNELNVENDKSASTGSSLKYYITAKDIKIASFTFDAGTREGTLIVAVQ
jgi:hypothetical protein